MKLVIESVSFALKVSLNWCRYSGLFVPDELSGKTKYLVLAYGGFMYFIFFGYFTVSLLVKMIIVWGDVDQMTEIGLVLATNLAFTAKVFVFIFKRKSIASLIQESEDKILSATREEEKDVVKEINRETNLFMKMYYSFGFVTASAAIWSTRHGKIYINTWYPCDITKSPIREIILLHQGITMFMLTSLDVAVDMMMVAMVALCRCRLKLIALTLEQVCYDLPSNPKNLITREEVKIVSKRVRQCAIDHQDALDCAANIQESFSVAILIQLLTSVAIMCELAYQLATDRSAGIDKRLSRTSYLFGMAVEIFLFCYQGEYLASDSLDVAEGAYNSPWYTFPTSIKRSLLVIMARAQNPPTLDAGGFTTLSLTAFVSIMKASYTYFTVLQQVSE